MARTLLKLRIFFAVAAILLANTALAQMPEITSGQNPEPQLSIGESVPTMFPHPEEGRYWISGQMNFILQQNAPFMRSIPERKAFIRCLQAPVHG